MKNLIEALQNENKRLKKESQRGPAKAVTVQSDHKKKKKTIGDVVFSAKDDVVQEAADFGLEEVAPRRASKIEQFVNPMAKMRGKKKKKAAARHEEEKDNASL